MPFIALLLDVAAIGAYAFQVQAHGFYTLGAIVQGVITVVLLVITFAYSGKRFAVINANFFWRNFSIRYGIIVLSLLANIAFLFLYIMYVTGRNNILFR